MRLSLHRAFALVVSVSLTGQIALGSLAESNVWAERRLNQRSNFASQVASLPPVAPLVPGLELGPMDKLVSSFPSALVSVQEVHPAATDTAPVILIQDVHLNAEAQENIAGLLRGLIDGKQLGFVGLEGAFAPLDFASFHALPEPAVKDIADAFLKKGLLSGASYAGLTLRNAPPFGGLDDRPHYDANVAAIRAGLVSRKDTLERLRALRVTLAAEKRAAFSPALLRLDESKASHESGRMGLGAYVEALAASAPIEGETLGRFLDAHRLERSLDFARAEGERDAVLRALANRLSAPDLAVLMKRSLAYRMGRIGFGRFYRDLLALCERHAVDLSRAPAFNAYIRYVLLSDGIRIARLYPEIRSLEKKAFARLIAGERDQALLDRSERLSLTEKLVSFSLTSDEWSAYRPGSPVAGLDVSTYEAFYREADARSDAMVKRLLSQPSTEARALVVGGFHAARIAASLKTRGIPYAVVSPKLTRADPVSATAYLSVFAREKTPLDRLFSGEKLFVCPRSVQIEDRNLFVPLLAAMGHIVQGVNPVRVFWKKAALDVTVPEDPTNLDAYAYAVPASEGIPARWTLDLLVNSAPLLLFWMQHERLWHPWLAPAGVLGWMLACVLGAVVTQDDESVFRSRFEAAFNLWISGREVPEHTADSATASLRQMADDAFVPDAASWARRLAEEAGLDLTRTSFVELGIGSDYAYFIGRVKGNAKVLRLVRVHVGLSYDDAYRTDLDFALELAQFKRTPLSYRRFFKMDRYDVPMDHGFAHELRNRHRVAIPVSPRGAWPAVTGPGTASNAPVRARTAGVTKQTLPDAPPPTEAAPAVVEDDDIFRILDDESDVLDEPTNTILAPQKAALLKRFGLPASVSFPDSLNFQFLLELITAFADRPALQERLREAARRRRWPNALSPADIVQLTRVLAEHAMPANERDVLLAAPLQRIAATTEAYRASLSSSDLIWLLTFAHDQLSGAIQERWLQVLNTIAPSPTSWLRLIQRRAGLPLLFRLLSFESPGISISWSPDPRYIRLQPENRTISAYALSRTLARCYTVDARGQLIVWRTDDAQRLSTRDLGGGDLTAVAVTSSEDHVAAGSSNGSVTVVHLATNHRRRLSTGLSRVTAMAFSEDGAELAVAGPVSPASAARIEIWRAWASDSPQRVQVINVTADLFRIARIVMNRRGRWMAITGAGASGRAEHRIIDRYAGQMFSGLDEATDIASLEEPRLERLLMNLSIPVPDAPAPGPATFTVPLTAPAQAASKKGQRVYTWFLAGATVGLGALACAAFANETWVWPAVAALVVALSFTTVSAVLTRMLPIGFIAETRKGTVKWNDAAMTALHPFARRFVVVEEFLHSWTTGFRWVQKRLDAPSTRLVVSLVEEFFVKSVALAAALLLSLPGARPLARRIGGVTERLAYGNYGWMANRPFPSLSRRPNIEDLFQAAREDGVLRRYGFEPERLREIVEAFLTFPDSPDGLPEWVLEKERDGLWGALRELAESERRIDAHAVETLADAVYERLGESEKGAEIRGHLTTRLGGRLPGLLRHVLLSLSGLNEPALSESADVLALIHFSKAHSLRGARDIAGRFIFSLYHTRLDPKDRAALGLPEKEETPDLNAEDQAMVIAAAEEVLARHGFAVVNPKAIVLPDITLSVGDDKAVARYFPDYVRDALSGTIDKAEFFRKLQMAPPPQSLLSALIALSRSLRLSPAERAVVEDVLRNRRLEDIEAWDVDDRIAYLSWRLKRWPNDLSAQLQMVISSDPVKRRLIDQMGRPEGMPGSHELLALAGVDPRLARAFDEGSQVAWGRTNMTPGFSESVEFNGSGKRVISKRNPGAHEIVDARTGDVIEGWWTTEQWSDHVLRFSPDGKRALSKSQEAVRLLDAATGEPVGPTMEDVGAATFGPDGSRVLVGFTDGTLRLLDSATGEPIGQPWVGNSAPGLSVSFSLDGRRAISANWDEVRLWDVATGNPVGRPLRREGATFSSAAVSPDGSRIVVRSTDGTIFLRDAVTGDLIAAPRRADVASVSSLYFSPDGKRFLSLSHAEAHLWDAFDGKPIGLSLTHEDRWSSAAAFSPDGSRVVVGFIDGVLRVFDGATGAPVGPPWKGHAEAVSSVSFGPDGTRVVSSSNRDVRLWRPATAARAPAALSVSGAAWILFLARWGLGVGILAYALFESGWARQGTSDFIANSLGMAGAMFFPFLTASNDDGGRADSARRLADILIALAEGRRADALGLAQGLARLHVGDASERDETAPFLQRWDAWSRDPRFIAQLERNLAGRLRGADGVGLDLAALVLTTLGVDGRDISKLIKGPLVGAPRVYVMKGREAAVVMAGVLRSGLDKPTLLAVEAGDGAHYERIAAALNRLAGKDVVRVRTYDSPEDVGLKAGAFRPERVRDDFLPAAGAHDAVLFVLSTGLVLDGTADNVLLLDQLLPPAVRRHLESIGAVLRVVLSAA